MDTTPRALSHDQRDALAALSRQIVRQLELRVAVRRERELSAHLAAETHERLRQSQKVETLGLLATGIAHDFNNLLTVINGMTELAVSEVGESDPVQQRLAEISQAGEQAVALTRQLLAVSRKQPLRVDLLDMNAIVHDMASMLRRLINKKISVELTTADALPAVRADLGQLQQILLNLVVNARDAIAKGGTIHIQTIDAGSHALLRVRDTGCGIDEATRARMFEPFFTTKAPGKGTGLGLSTIADIVKQSGGTIEVESVLGEGTTFTIALPAACVSASGRK